MADQSYTPRNLAEPIADWLRKQGFTCTVQQMPTLTVVHAGWSGPRHEHFELTYIWQVGADATLQLRLISAQPSLHVEVLLAAQRVHLSLIHI